MRMSRRNRPAASPQLLLIRESALEAIERLREPWLVVQRGDIIHRLH
jgi:hypothetical protein